MILRSTNFWLFIILSLNFWLLPLLPEDFTFDSTIEWLMGVTLLFAVIMQGIELPRIRKWAALACVIILAAIIAEEVFSNAKYIENAVFAVSFAVVTALYFHRMTYNLGAVTYDTVLAAACTYILIGLFFASIFGLVVEFDPAAFAGNQPVLSYYDLLYFSFATLTTLGAVDVAPVSDLAKMLTVFEAIMGLIYVAILVGAVVGSFAARRAGR